MLSQSTQIVQTGVVGTVGGIDDLDDVYDAETLARIERARSRRPAPGDPRPRSRRIPAGALAAALMLGVADVLDPPRRVEIAEVDPWGAADADRNRWVRLRWSADPARTIAFVRHR